MVLILSAVSVQAAVGGSRAFVWSNSLHGNGSEKASQEKDSCQALKNNRKAFPFLILCTLVTIDVVNLI